MNRPLGLAAVLAVAAFARPAAACESWKMQAKIDARTIHPVAEKYKIDHPGQCPTVEQLQAERELSAASKLTDPWDTPYQIRCADEDVYVLSFGCDKIEGTADDIVVPEPESATVSARPAGRCRRPGAFPGPLFRWTEGPSFARTAFVGLVAGTSGLLALAFADHVAFVEGFLR